MCKVQRGNSFEKQLRLADSSGFISAMTVQTTEKSVLQLG